VDKRRVRAGKDEICFILHLAENVLEMLHLAFSPSCWHIRIFFSPHRDVQKLGSCSRKSYLSQSMKNEWKLAKIAFVVIIVFVLSWSPYACVTLIAWAG